MEQKVVRTFQEHVGQIKCAIFHSIHHILFAQII